jgi:hypothetical protein
MDLNREALRLKILQVLRQQQGYTAHQEILLVELKRQGFVINRDQLHIELAWLDNNAGCLVNQVVGSVHIATLTGDGLEVVEGLQEIPAIAKPRPEELS